MSSSSMLSRSTSSSSRICTQDTRRRISFFTSIIFLNHPIISYHTVYFFHGDKKSNLVFFWECRDFLLFLFILHCSSSSRFSSDMSCSHRLLATLCLPEKVSEMQIILLISDYSIYLLENPTYADYWRYKQAEWGTTSCKYYINRVNIRSKLAQQKMLDTADKPWRQREWRFLWARIPVPPQEYSCLRWAERCWEFVKIQWEKYRKR